MANGNCSDELLETYGRLQEAFSHTGGYDYEIRIQQTLTGLGLGRAAWDMLLNHLSGGQKTRALLERLPRWASGVRDLTTKIPKEQNNAKM